MCALPYRIRLRDPTGKRLVELLGRHDPKLMHEELGGVGGHVCDPSVADLALQVEVADDASPVRPSPGETLTVP